MGYTANGLFGVLRDIHTDITFVSKRGPILYTKIKGRRGYVMEEGPGGANRVVQYMADRLRNHAWGKEAAYDLKWFCKREDNYTVSRLDLPEDENVPDIDKYTLIRLDPNKLNYDKFSQYQWEVRHNIGEDVIIVPDKIKPDDIIDSESALEYVARAVLNEQSWIQIMPVFFSHDYHNSTLNKVIKRLLENSPDRNALFAHFEHTPLPSAKNFGLFDEVERYDGRKQTDVLLTASLVNDIYFLQTKANVQRYLDTVQTYIPKKEYTIQHKKINGVDFYVVRYRDHDTWVKAVPVSVDPEDLRKRASRTRVKNEARKARTNVDNDTIVVYSTDRGGEETKGVAKKLSACNKFKQRHPGANVIVNQQYDPSRTEILRYQAELRRIEEEGKRGNDAFPGYITLDPEKYKQDRILHRYRAFDVLLITSIADGMNLVAKEGAVLADLGRPTVIILSKDAGAAEQLGNAGAILTDSHDEESIIRALEYVVYKMTPEERWNRAKALRKSVEKENMEDHTYNIFSSIAERRNEKLASKK